MLVACLVSCDIVYLLQIVHVENHYRELRMAMLLDLAVNLILRLQERMLVLDSRQRVDVRLALRLRETPRVVFFLPHVRVDVVYAHDEARTVAFLHYGSLDLDIHGVAVHRDAQRQREDAPSLDFREDAVPGEQREETGAIVSIDVIGPYVSRNLEEIHAVLGQGEWIELPARTVFAVAPGGWDHDINA